MRIRQMLGNVFELQKYFVCLGAKLGHCSRSIICRICIGNLISPLADFECLG
jgi:hypothetical protein